MRHWQMVFRLSLDDMRYWKKVFKLSETQRDITPSSLISLTVGYIGFYYWSSCMSDLIKWLQNCEFLHLFERVSSFTRKGYSWEYLQNIQHRFHLEAQWNTDGRYIVISWMVYILQSDVSSNQIQILSKPSIICISSGRLLLLSVSSFKRNLVRHFVCYFASSVTRSLYRRHTLFFPNLSFLSFPRAIWFSRNCSVINSLYKCLL